MALIQCDEISIAYEGQTVVRDLSFQIEQGDYLCIVGENGSGKSTLVKSLLGLKPPFKGQILLGDGLKQDEIGYLPQQTVVQKDFPASVYEVVLSGRLNSRGWRPFYSAADKKAARENMELLGIREMEHQCFRDLSGGQKQRVLLARALCATKKLLLLDEPVTGLDPLVTAEFYQLIEKINKEAKIAVVMVSHDIESTIQYASHILHLQESALFYGTAQEYQNSTVGKRFLGRRICNSSGQAPEDYHTIRGVVHDFRTEVASGLVEPIVLHNLNEWMPREDRAYGHTNLCLRLHEITPEVLKAVSEKLHAFETADNYRIRVLDTLIDETLRTERRVHDLTLLAGSIVLLITLVGLTGYLGDEMRRRSREIAIRKVNGASAADIFALLTRGTAALTFPAVAAGTLAGYLVLARLLELFVERIALRWWIFAGAAAAVIGLVLVILLLRIRRMATENPINRIKTE